jgi:hypothetical protein
VTTMPEKKTTEIIVTVSWVNDQFNCVGYNWQFSRMITYYFTASKWVIVV